MTILAAVYVTAPLLVAGAVHAPVLRLNLLARLAVPLDFGRTFAGDRIFGANKTWRGVAVMSSLSTAVVIAQIELYAYEPFRELGLFDYTDTKTYALGPALGLAYSCAELPNSFAKRRLGIAPGGVSARYARAQYIIDQADSPVAGTLVLIPFVGARLGTLLVVFVVGLALHVLMDNVFFLVGAKRRVSNSPAVLEGAPR